VPDHAIGRTLRQARQRRGWSRETLAHISGVSWAAIAQIETGRRTDVRLNSLVQLARALDVTIDELVDDNPPARPPMSHSALLYSTADEFAAAAVPYLREGVARDERPLAVTSPERIERVRAGLGDDADKVMFADWIDWYRSPVAALNGYRDYLNDQVASGAKRVRILGEPVWRGRTQAEVRAWIRYESLVNIVFAESPSVLLCPYNVQTSPAAVVTAAHQTHPLLSDGLTSEASGAYQEAEALLLEP
jgi:transcriptional regulator with XRE-family HTH domain